MKICVIGSGGFLARKIIAYCQKSETKIVALGRSKLQDIASGQFVEIDLLKQPIPLDICLKSDVIIYAAGLGIQSSVVHSNEDLYTINSFIPITFIEKLKQQHFSGKVVTFGSYFEIGSTKDLKKFYSEEEIVLSNNKIANDYCISKRLLSRYIADLDCPFIFHHCILPTIYGIGEQKSRLIPYLVNSLLDNKEVRLTAGTQIRQYLLVDDAVRLLFKMIEGNFEQGIYNFPCGETSTIKQIATVIYDAFSRPPDEHIFNRETKQDQSMQVLQLNSQKLAAKLKQEHLYTLKDYLERTNFSRWN